MLQRTRSASTRHRPPVVDFGARSRRIDVDSPRSPPSPSGGHPAGGAGSGARRRRGPQRSEDRGLSGDRTRGERLLASPAEWSPIGPPTANGGSPRQQKRTLLAQPEPAERPAGGWRRIGRPRPQRSEAQRGSWAVRRQDPPARPLQRRAQSSAAYLIQAREDVIGRRRRQADDRPLGPRLLHALEVLLAAAHPERAPTEHVTPAGLLERGLDLRQLAQRVVAHRVGQPAVAELGHVGDRPRAGVARP